VNTHTVKLFYINSNHRCVIAHSVCYMYLVFGINDIVGGST